MTLVVDEVGSKEEYTPICRPLTEDRLVGYDKSGRLLAGKKDGEWTSWVGIIDVRLMICPICMHGWEPTAASLLDQMRWELILQYTHRSCYIRHEGFNEASEFHAALYHAKVRFGPLVAVDNGYWRNGDPWGAKPWYHVELLEHPVLIEIGNRKRVTSIRFKPQGGTKLEWCEEAKKLFADENVTKEFWEHEVLMHAYTREKVCEYLKKICDVAGYAVKDAT